MTIAVTPEQEALADAVRGWATRHSPPELVRAVVAGTPPGESIWQALADQSLLGLHIDEEYGGSGAGATELAVLCEELGRALAPGAIVPSLLCSAVIQDAAPRELAKHLLPELAVGNRRASIALSAAGVAARERPDGWTVEGTAAHVLAGAEATWLLLGAQRSDGRDIWFVVDADADGVETETVPSLDLTRPVARVSLRDVFVPVDRLLPELDTARVRDLATLVLGAEATGIAGWCLDTSVAYARSREQFGVPIGEFQAVKHRCADMLVAVEQAAALIWDAAEALGDDPEQREIAAAVAAAMAPQAAVANAQACIQLHGGMGYTWEHDSHLYLRRATSTRQLLGHPAVARDRVATAVLSGTRRVVAVDVGDSDIRQEVRALLEQASALEEPARRRHLADHGFLAPHWPRPWGRGAGAREQLVIQQEMQRAGVKAAPLVMGDWVLPTLIAHGSDEQRERFMKPTLYGEIIWCQMFSEPGAGSDLAGLSTRAERVDGGWVLTGQKVWTSIAQYSHWAICLARTDPSAPKHQGITYFLVDMRSDGLDIRPLREMTGHEMFNEVFLDKVFVPDDCVVGEVELWLGVRPHHPGQRARRHRRGAGDGYDPGGPVVPGRPHGSRRSATRP
jgi:3-oxochol-4-en-24-oyl-CoA dehydrogenase